MPVARPQPVETRVIAHVDLDCFYVQVEQRRRSELRGQPTAVVQYNSWKGGALIAVSYEARKFGVKRSMRGEEARKACPDINLIQVPVAHDKADLKLYRDAGSEVCNILATMGKCERASIDEVYLDITEAATARLIQDPPQSWASINKEALKSHVVGLPEDGEAALAVGHWLQRLDADQSDQLLVCGAVIIAELRAAVLAETQFTCSAGIAHNKMLAKLASGMHKPAQQTIVPFGAVERLLSDLPIDKIGQLGGKLGNSLKVQLGIKTAGDLLRFSETKLQDLFGTNTGTWLWRTARGINGDEVKERMLPKSHSSGKTFPGPKALKDLNMVDYWLKEMAEVLQERLDMDTQQNNRTARLLTLHAECHRRSNGPNYTKKFPSKSCALRYGKEKIADDALRLFEKALQEFCPALNLSPRKKGNSAISTWRVTGISLSASNIVATPWGVDPITRFFGSSIHPVQDSSADKSSFLAPMSPESSLDTSISGKSSMLGITSMHTQGPIDAADNDLPADLWYSDICEECNKERCAHPSKLVRETNLGSLVHNSCVDAISNTLVTKTTERLKEDFQHTNAASDTIRKEHNLYQESFCEHSSLELHKEIMNTRTCNKGIDLANNEGLFHNGSLSGIGVKVSQIASNGLNVEGDMKLDIQGGSTKCFPTHGTLRFPLPNDHEGGNHEATCTPSTGTVNNSEVIDESLLLSKQTISSISSRQQQRKSIQKRDPEAREAASSITLSSSPEKLVVDSVTYKEAVASHITSTAKLPASESFKDPIMDGYTTVTDCPVKTGQLSLVKEPSHENISTSTDGQSSEPFLGIPKRSRQLGLAQLMEFWKHKSLGNNPIPVGPSQKDALKQYESEEIDESILAELPAEIQLELKNVLRIKRRHTLKKSTIGDFFKH